MTAVVVGASGGIGAALVAALEEEGTPVLGLARSFDRRAPHRPAGRSRRSRPPPHRSPPGPPPTLIIVATGLLHAGEHGPGKGLARPRSRLARAQLCRQRDRSGAGRQAFPAADAQGRAHGLRRAFGPRRQHLGQSAGRLVRLSRVQGRAQPAGPHASRIEDKRRNPRGIVVALHPGTVDTALSKPFQGNVQPGRLFDARSCRRAAARRDRRPARCPTAASCSTGRARRSPPEPLARVRVCA